MRHVVQILELIGFLTIIVVLGYYLWPICVLAYIVRCAMRFYRARKPKHVARYTHAPSKRPLTITFER